MVQKSTLTDNRRRRTFAGLYLETNVKSPMMPKSPKVEKSRKRLKLKSTPPQLRSTDWNRVFTPNLPVNQTLTAEPKSPGAMEQSDAE